LAMSTLIGCCVMLRLPRLHRPNWKASSIGVRKTSLTRRHGSRVPSERFEKDAPTLGESERGRRQRDLVEQDRELQRKRREFQEDLNQRKNEELATVLDRATARGQADF
jgi:hypothetical protein